MEIVAIQGEQREPKGKKQAKDLRKNNMIPSVIYGGEENIHFQAHPSQFKALVYTPDFKLAEVTVDGKTYKCILKDIQFHPVTDAILHIDLLQLVPEKPFKVNLPIGFKGTSPGVKTGGKLIQKIRRLKVKTTPEKLVDRLLVDISTLKLGSSVRVRDVEPPEGIEITYSPGIPIASVETPRSLRSETAAAEKGEGEAVEE